MFMGIPYFRPVMYGHLDIRKTLLPNLSINPCDQTLLTIITRNPYDQTLDCSLLEILTTKPIR